jgi:hypothetical protein
VTLGGGTAGRRLSCGRSPGGGRDRMERSLRKDASEGRRHRLGVMCSPYRATGHTIVRPIFKQVMSDCWFDGPSVPTRHEAWINYIFLKFEIF